MSTHRYTEINELGDGVGKSLELGHKVRLEGHRVLREVFHPLDELLREHLSAPRQVEGLLKGLEELRLSVHTSHVQRNICRILVNTCAECQMSGAYHCP